MQSRQSAVLLSVSGFIALAVAMGIGRFAFTPMLPMMQNDAGLGLAQGGWLASANYLGYLVGALMAASLPWPSTTQLRAGLLLVVATTLLMGITDTWLSWLAWRFIAGVASAWVLVGTSSLCLPRLAALGHPHQAGLVFAGVGGGVAVAGLLCMALDLAAVSSSIAWLLLGAVAFAGALGARSLWTTPLPAPLSTATPATTKTASASSSSTIKAYWTLIGCYALFGFGYILPATFLPAQAKLLVADPALFGLAWPLFGLAAAISTLLTSRLTTIFPRRTLWAGAQIIMAAGVLLPVLWPSLFAIAIAAICVGGTFMVITMLGMQEAQAIGGAQTRKLMAALTAAFAAGQLAGPIFFSLTHTYFAAGLGFALILAAIGLVLSSLLLLKPGNHQKET